MIRTLVTSQQQNIFILVPQNYVGKQIEVLLYAADEVKEEKIKSKKSIIASTAIVHELTLLTRNTADFKSIPELKVANPWRM